MSKKIQKEHEKQATKIMNNETKIKKENNYQNLALIVRFFY